MGLGRAGVPPRDGLRWHVRNLYTDVGHRFVEPVRRPATCICAWRIASRTESLPPAKLITSTVRADE